MKVRLQPLFTAAALLLPALCAHAQVIEYELNGLKYQVATRKGLTVIVSHLPNHVAGFGLLQVSISNGSDIYWTVKPEDFAYVHGETTIAALPADQVVDMMLDKGTHSDVVKLVESYEASLYAIPNMRASNGYEQRRQNSMSFGMSSKLKAAATASAIAMGTLRMAAGQSTDGAVFFPLTHEVHTLAGGHVVFRAEGEVFEFKSD